MAVQIANGVTYKANTPVQVVNVLERARANGKRIRIFYGDPETGRDWMEQYHNIGTISSSWGGRVSVPLLIPTARSHGGLSILDHCIVKITMDRQVLYEHPRYHLPLFSVQPHNDPKRPDLKIAVYGKYNGESPKLLAAFEDTQKAENWVMYIIGKRNRP